LTQNKKGLNKKEKMKMKRFFLPHHHDGWLTDEDLHPSDSYNQQERKKSDAIPGRM
jgi:hypothetical protein